MPCVVRFRGGRLAGVPRWHARGQGFKSPQLHQAQRIGRVPAQGRLSADCQQITGSACLEPFWNIPGAPGETSWNEGVHRYVLHLSETYSTIKASDPSAIVLLGGLSGHFMEQYIDRLVDERAYRYFDAMNLHPYAANPHGVVARVKSAQRHMSRAPGMASKPLWITEFGWQATWAGSFMYVPSEEVKASYLAQTIARLREAGIDTPTFCYRMSGINGPISPGRAPATSTGSDSSVGRRRTLGRSGFLPTTRFARWRSDNGRLLAPAMSPRGTGNRRPLRPGPGWAQRRHRR